MNSKMLIAVFVCLPACSYRYGIGYFTNDIPPATMPVAYPQTPAPPADACSGDEEEKLIVTNKLDSKSQTIETTAISRRSSKVCSGITAQISKE